MLTVIAFTTGDSLPSGRVSGKVGPLAATDAARVFALGAGPDTSEVPSFKEGRMLSAAETDSGGVFHLGYLLPAIVSGSWRSWIATPPVHSRRSREIPGGGRPAR